MFLYLNLCSSEVKVFKGGFLLSSILNCWRVDGQSFSCILYLYLYSTVTEPNNRIIIILSSRNGWDQFSGVSTSVKLYFLDDSEIRKEQNQKSPVQYRESRLGTIDSSTSRLSKCRSIFDPFWCSHLLRPLSSSSSQLTRNINHIRFFFICKKNIENWFWFPSKIIYSKSGRTHNINYR